MKITILTLFPEMFDGFLTNSIIKRAIGKNVVEVKIVNIRDYTKDKYGRVDTPPIGGGAGLIMKCQPIVDALKDVSSSDSKKIMLSPRGKQFNQQMAVSLSEDKDLVLLCGHYEGIDERVNDYVDELISIGDYEHDMARRRDADGLHRVLPAEVAGRPARQRLPRASAREEYVADKPRQTPDAL